MINYIHIKNIAIMEELEINFKEGLNVLTGETGVGKSIIINAINFALGAKTNKEIIRKGAESATCEIIFSVPNELLVELIDTYNLEDGDGDLLISRTLNTAGKNIYKINGSVTTVGIVKSVTSKIIDIHGQHEHQSLFNVNEHINVLDRFAHKDIKDIKTKLEEKYGEYKEIGKKITNLQGNDNDRERKLDILTYEINEIDAANLRENEEEELQSKRIMMMSGDKIMKSMSTSHNALDIAADNIAKGIYEIEKVVKYEEKFEEMVTILKEAEALVLDVKEETLDYAESLSFDEEEQSRVEERLELIDKLKRKYGNDIKTIIDYKKKREEELDLIINSENILIELKEKHEKIKKEIIKLCKDLSEKRLKNAELISNKIEKNLHELEMKNAKFEITIKQKEEFNENGFDLVEFMFSSNLGEEVKELSKIASGGEVSRVMLAIKNVLAETDEIGTLIFDEIDTGISGMAAQKVAEKMTELSRSHQLICITHLPQIAAMADNNYKIEKEEKEGRTLSNISLLDGDEQIKEIARLVAGVKMTDSAIAHAQEMKLEADNLKLQVG